MKCCKAWTCNFFPPVVFKCIVFCCVQCCHEDHVEAVSFVHRDVFVYGCCYHRRACRFIEKFSWISILKGRLRSILFALFIMIYFFRLLALPYFMFSAMTILLLCHNPFLRQEPLFLLSLLTRGNCIETPAVLSNLVYSLFIQGGKEGKSLLMLSFMCSGTEIPF